MKMCFFVEREYICGRGIPFGWRQVYVVRASLDGRVDLGISSTYFSLTAARAAMERQRAFAAIFVANMDPILQRLHHNSIESKRVEQLTPLRR